MIELLQEIQARCEVIFVDQKFSDPAGGMSVPMVKIGSLDPKQSGAENDQDFPFVVVRPVKGLSDPRENRVDIQIIGGIWSAEDDVIHGFTAIDSMMALLLGIGGTRGFAPYRLSMPLSFELGENGGNQPHPYYYISVNLSFVKTVGC